MSGPESCVCLYIRNLVSTLTNKKQFKTTAAELQKLTATFGIGAEKFLLGVFLQDIDFKDPRISSGGKDQFKVQFLNQAITHFSAKPAFLDYFSQVFPSGDIEEFFEEFSRNLHLTLPVQILLALSLALSSTPHVSRAGTVILKNKLKEYCAQGKPQRIPAYAIHSILFVLRNYPEFTEEAACGEWIEFLLLGNQIDERVYYLPLLKEGKETYNLPEVRPTIMNEIKSSLALAEVLEDLGPLCSQSSVTLREVFMEFPDIKETEMAEALAMMCEKTSDTLDQESRVISAVYSSVHQEAWQALTSEFSEKKSIANWNLDVFSKTVRESYTLQWELVVEMLDIPRFVIKNEQAFVLLTTLYYKITGKKFPIMPFFKIWKNPRGQVSFLMHAIYSSVSSEIFNFSDTPNKVPIEEIAMQPDVKCIIQALLSLDLLKVLIELSVTEFYPSIRNLLINEAKHFPDILIIGLSMIKPSRGHHLLTELISMMMPQFMTPQTTNPIVLQTIWTHNPDLIIKGAIEYYEKDSTSLALSNLLDLTQEIRDSLLKLVACDNHKFTVHFGLLASKRDFLHLEHWINERLANGKNGFIIALLDYIEDFVLKPSAEAKDPKQIEAILDKAQITKEALAIIFEKLIDAQPSQELQKRAYEVYNNVIKQFPEIKPPNLQEDVDEKANLFFQQLYSEEISVSEFIGHMKKLKGSANKHETDIFECVINNLFDEFRFFHKYPEKELRITGEIFGAMIKYGVLVSVHLFVGLKHIVMALKKPRSKLSRFGFIALEQFKDRLSEWPNFCSELLAVENLQDEQPEFVKWLQSIKNKTSEVPEDPPVHEEPVILTDNPPGIPKPPETAPQPVWKSPIEEVSDPSIPDATKDRIMFIINTTDLQKLEEKAAELRKILSEDENTNIPWFANYLVVKRVSQEINFQDLYLKLLKSVDIKKVYSSVLNETYYAIWKLLTSHKELEDSDRKVLNSLGAWIGSLTLARNKPILLKHLDLKDLVIKAYEEGTLLAIIPFVCNILKSCGNSEVFNSNNPWVISNLSLLVELKSKPELKLRIVSEIELLFRLLKQSPDDFPKTNLLVAKESKKTQDFAVKEAQSPQETIQLSTEQGILSSLPSYVTVSPKLAELYSEPELRRMIALAIEKAIKEIIQPIVQRNVNIALITTKELVLKDFAFEKDANKLQQASVWVVKSLAGSLAQVTSREPFRVHVVNFLAEILRTSTTLNNQTLKQIVEQAALDNLELGCGLIAKIVIEKAVSDVGQEETLKDAFQMRRISGDKFYDENAAARSRAVQFLPDNLKPKLSGLTKEQFQVYHDFVNIIENPKKISQSQPAPPAKSSPSPEAKPDTSPQSLKFDDQLEQAESIMVAKNDVEDPEVQQAISNVTLSAIASNSKTESVSLCAQKLFRRMYTTDDLTSFYIQILQNIKNQQRNITKEITSWLISSEDSKRFYWPVTSEIIKGDLIQLNEFDKIMGKAIENDNQMAIQFAVRLIKEMLLSSRVVANTEVQETVTALRAAKDRFPGNDELGRVAIGLNEISSESRAVPTMSAEKARLREVIEGKFNEWLNLTLEEPFINSEKVPTFVKSLEPLGLLNFDDKIEFFFKTIAEIAISRSRFTDEAYYAPIDSFTKLSQVIIVLARSSQKSKILGKVLSAVKSLIVSAASEPIFNQRPYFRILLDILTESTQPNVVFPDQVLVQELLLPIAKIFHELNPCRVPAFAFSWLELISHRFFLPKMLRTVNISAERRVPSTHWKKMHLLLMDLFKFIYLNFSKVPLTESLKAFYQGVLRMLLILMHDFPEFLCDYHSDFCDYIPEHCCQMKNLVLSAYPRTMRVPLPFTPNLKVDLLPEMNVSPNILSSYKEKLSFLSIKDDIDRYFSTRDAICVKEICNKMMIPDPSTPAELIIRANVIVINAFVLYVAEWALSEGGNQRDANDLFLSILLNLENEARKHFINAIANQLRYPNSHTQFFSCVLFFLFSECKKPIIEEQISRVLTERAIVHRPHPWGILITLIELIKNPRYEFLKKPFTRCTPEIERLYEKMSKNCVPGPLSQILNS